MRIGGRRRISGLDYVIALLNALGDLVQAERADCSHRCEHCCVCDERSDCASLAMNASRKKSFETAGGELLAERQPG